MTEEKPDKPDIETILGHTNILLIAPHGVESDPLEDLPLDDIGTAELTRQIQKHLGCSAVINTAFRKPTGKDLTKRNHGVPDLKAKVLNLNLVVQASKVEDFKNGIEKVVATKGLTYVFWIHGIADGNIELIRKDVQCLLGYGQPNTKAKPKEQPHPTAEQKIIDTVLREFEQKGIKTVPAPETSKYRGWKKTYMNQWFLLKKYDFDQVQSIQLEFKKTGFRRGIDIKAAAKKIANAISALVQPEIKATSTVNNVAGKDQEQEMNSTKKADDTNKTKNEGKTESIPPGNENFNAEVPSNQNAIGNENTKTKVEVPEPKPPGEADTNAKANIESEPVEDEDQELDALLESEGDIEVEEEVSQGSGEKTPAQGTAQIQKITDPAETEGAIEVGSPLIEKAYNKLSNIFSKNYEQALIEAGQYIVRTFYAGEEAVEDLAYDEKYEFTDKVIKRADDNDSPLKESLNKLIEKIQGVKETNTPSRSWVFNAVNLTVQNHQVNTEKELKPLVHSYGQLLLTHKICLLKVKDITIKQALIEEESQNPSTVKAFNEKIKKLMPPDPKKPLTLRALLKKPEELMKEENAEKLSLKALKSTQTRTLENLKTITDTQHENIEAEINDIKKDLEKRQQFLEKYSKVKMDIEQAIQQKKKPPKKALEKKKATEAGMDI